MKCN